MDYSSRKIVKYIAIIALTVMAVIAAKFYVDSVSEPNNPAALPAPEALSDSDEAAATQDQPAKAASEFSTDVPVPEEIPAINGEPSMVLPSSDNNASAPPAPEAAKRIPE